MFSLFLKGIKENKQLFIRQIKDKKTEKAYFFVYWTHLSARKDEKELQKAGTFTKMTTC